MYIWKVVFVFRYLQTYHAPIKPAQPQNVPSMRHNVTVCLLIYSGKMTIFKRLVCFGPIIIICNRNFDNLIFKHYYYPTVVTTTLFWVITHSNLTCTLTSHRWCASSIVRQFKWPAWAAQWRGVEPALSKPLTDTYKTHTIIRTYMYYKKIEHMHIQICIYIQPCVHTCTYSILAV